MKHQQEFVNSKEVIRTAPVLKCLPLEKTRKTASCASKPEVRDTQFQKNERNRKPVRNSSSSKIKILWLQCSTLFPERVCSIEQNGAYFCVGILRIAPYVNMLVCIALVDDGGKCHTLLMCQWCNHGSTSSLENTYENLLSNSIQKFSRISERNA